MESKSLQTEALDIPRLTLDELAEAAEVSRSSLEKYREGKYPMPVRVRLRIAAFLKEHARQLDDLADELTTTEEALRRPEVT